MLFGSLYGGREGELLSAWFIFGSFFFNWEVFETREVKFTNFNFQDASFQVLKFWLLATCRAFFEKSERRVKLIFNS